MSSFTTPLIISPVSEKNVPDDLKKLNKKWWETERKLIYYIGFIGSPLKIVIPKGFYTDLASIPSIFRIFFVPHDPQYAAASVLHDYLYKYSLIDEYGNNQSYSKMFSDAVFYEALMVLGTPRWKASLFYVSLRIANLWKAYRGNVNVNANN